MEKEIPSDIEEHAYTLMPDVQLAMAKRVFLAAANTPTIARVRARKNRLVIFVAGWLWANRL